MKIYARISSVGLALLVLVVLQLNATAQIVTINATVSSPPDTIVVFSGIAYPHAPITILEDGAPFTTTTANANARFSVTTGSVTPGAHTYALSAKDAVGRDSKTYQVILNIVDETTTTVGNIFFGPTVELSSTTIQEGDIMTFFGITSPNSTVSIQVIGSTTQNFSVTANTSGVWTRNFNAELVEGFYTLRARATDPNTSLSEWSNVLLLTVGAPPDPCLVSNIADINCDGEVDLTDLSILLSFWGQTNPSNTRVDIYADTKVDLIDFSIMMYHWTGPS